MQPLKINIYNIIYIKHTLNIHVRNSLRYRLVYGNKVDIFEKCKCYFGAFPWPLIWNLVNSYPDTYNHEEGEKNFLRLFKHHYFIDWSILNILFSLGTDKSSFLNLFKFQFKWTFKTRFLNIITLRLLSFT